MNNVMLDLETLATSHNACIVQIAAVRFDITNGKVSDIFNILVDPLDSVRYGREISEHTLSDFWSKQPPAVKELIPNAFTNGLKLRNALLSLQQFVAEIDNTKVWGNGVLFDNAIIRNAWESAGLDGQPWSYRADMCFRTAMQIHRDTCGKLDVGPFDGVKHNAVDDCKHQIKKLVKAYDSIGFVK